MVTVGGMVGAASVEWHLHAWDLAASLGKDYEPASPELLAAGWRAGMPHLPLATAVTVAPNVAAVAGARANGGSRASGGSRSNGGSRAGTVGREGAWQAMLRASGRPPR